MGGQILIYSILMESGIFVARALTTVSVSLWKQTVWLTHDKENLQKYSKYSVHLICSCL